jgi:hypothetical protein
MRALLIVGLLVGGAAVVAGLEALARSARGLMVEPRLGTFLRRRPPSRPARPVTLVQLEQLVGEALAGHEASRARLEARVAAIGGRVAPGATATQLAEIVAGLVHAGPDVDAGR